MAITDTLGSVIPQGNTITLLIILFIVGFVAFIILGLVAFFIYQKKKWNLKVEIKLPRSDGKITVAEWGKGFFDAKRGVVLIKRPGRGIKAIPMKVFDIRIYLQGPDLLTVVQIGPERYLPVLNESWTEYIDDKTGERASILNIKVDTGEHKAWAAQWSAAAKNAYSLQSFIQQFQTPIAIAIVLVACFIGFAILWSRMG